jgi:hypothetical protein
VALLIVTALSFLCMLFYKLGKIPLSMNGHAVLALMWIWVIGYSLYMMRAAKRVWWWVPVAVVAALPTIVTWFG